MDQKKIVIIGAGPTGLGCRLQDSRNSAIKTSTCTIASTTSAALRPVIQIPPALPWDVGGHVMFSHYKYYDKCFEDLMGSDFQLNMRECWVRMFNTWVPYPFQNNIRYLPKEVTFECLTGLIEAQTKRDYKSATNFKEFMEAVFGDGICKHFMTPYNFKVWGHPAELMNKEWIGERGCDGRHQSSDQERRHANRRFWLGAEQPVQISALRRHWRILSPLR